MLQEIRQYAESLGMSRGELLRLARELAEDACLQSVGHMRFKDKRMLRDILGALVRNQEKELVSLAR